MTTHPLQTPALTPAGLVAAGLIYDIRRIPSAGDQGAQIAIFFKGCPMDCWWCSSPESQLPMQEVRLNEKRCVRCGSCVSCCPLDAVTLEETGPEINREICIGCGTCAGRCEGGAREVVGRRYTAEEIMAEIEAGLSTTNMPGGEVLFTGGEPLIQRTFLFSILAGCKQRGIRTVVDTTGFAPWDAIESILPYVDLFHYEVKLINEARHIQYTGVSNQVILENLRRLSSLKHPIVLRAPVIAGINDDAESVRDLCDLAAGLQLERVELVPYLPSPEKAYESLGRAYRMPELRAPSVEIVASMADCLKQSGLSVTIAG